MLCPILRPMNVTPKGDRTSAVVAGTLILLTVVGVLTVFWEPLGAILDPGNHSGITSSVPRTPDGGS